MRDPHKVKEVSQIVKHMTMEDLDKQTSELLADIELCDMIPEDAEFTEVNI